MKAARPSKRARLTEEGPLCSWRTNYHILFNTFTLSRTHVLCHDYCQVRQLRLDWENEERWTVVVTTGGKYLAFTHAHC